MKSILVDIDGTIADINHRRHFVLTKPKNWKAFFAGMHLDSPRLDVLNQVDVFRKYDHKIVLATGRDEKHRETTVAWLNEHNIGFDALYMRPLKDMRADDIVKEEMYLNRIVPDGFDVKYVFDDRPRVIRMWRKLGLSVFDVGDGTEF